jgi:hypothetical protein
MPTSGFILGSPRSGTTLLGDILDLHPRIGRWYEPVFVLDRCFADAPDDCRRAKDASDEVKQYISNAFDDFQRRIGCDIVVAKTPGSCLKVPFLLELFPDAKFIHIVRDGRDATLSIHREWSKRASIVESEANLRQAARVLWDFLDRQPFLDHKLAALSFEIGSFSNLLKGRRHMVYRLRRWGSRTGWGPQFEGWQDAIDQVSTLEFNAMQWVKCVEAVLRETRILDGDQVTEVRYEELLERPEETLRSLCDFLETPLPGGFMTRLPELKVSNYGKWRRAFSDEEKALIGPILNPLLIQLGYADSDWYTCQG